MKILSLLADRLKKEPASQPLSMEAPRLRGSELGRWAECRALEHVTSLGWRVLGTNERSGGGELDIVAMDGDELVAVEVRCRNVGILQPAECTVGPTKMKRLVRAARTYVNAKNWQGPWRIDLIHMDIRDNICTTGHIKDITAGQYPV